VYSILPEGGGIRQEPLLQNFYDYLAPKPWCTDALGPSGYLIVRPKAKAVRFPYIQYNPIHRAYWLVFDIDRSEPRYWPEEYGLPCPNMEAWNKQNGHQHLFYMIDPAVYTLRNARWKPLKFAADVDKGLTVILGADPAYGKLTCKNPLSPQWLIVIWHEHAWGLNELIDYIPDKVKKWKPKPREVIGLGRNCTVFEAARKYAYKEWRRLDFQDYDSLYDSVFGFAANYNAGFTNPMLNSEVKSISRSVSKWTARHMDARGFSAHQAWKGRRSGKVRLAKANKRADEIRAFHAGHPQFSVRELAALFDVSKSTVANYLQDK
jgi:hypothetical protein